MGESRKEEQKKALFPREVAKETDSLAQQTLPTAKRAPTAKLRTAGMRADIALSSLAGLTGPI